MAIINDGNNEIIQQQQKRQWTFRGSRVGDGAPGAEIWPYITRLRTAY